MARRKSKNTKLIEGIIIGVVTAVAVVVMVTFQVLKMLFASFSDEKHVVKRLNAKTSDFTFLIGIVGESFDNSNGVSRQKIIKKECKAGDILILKPYNDPHDEFAVGVFTETGKQIGFIPRDESFGSHESLNEHIHETYKNGWNYSAEIESIHGGTEDKPSVGVVIRIFIKKPI